MSTDRQLLYDVMVPAGAGDVRVNGVKLQSSSA